jgi:hypothetical protein
MRSRTRTLLAGLLLMVLAVAACGSSTPTIPNITGTWTGTSSYADVDGTVKGSPETFIVTKQDGALVWATVEYANPDGSRMKEAITGTILSDGTSFVFTERASLWQGAINGSKMSVIVSWMGDPSHGAFEMTLTKQ